MQLSAANDRLTVTQLEHEIPHVTSSLTGLPSILNQAAREYYAAKMYWRGNLDHNSIDHKFEAAERSWLAA